MTVNKCTFNELMKGKTDYSIKTKSYSPFFSSIGLLIDDKPGIGAFHLNFNRSTRKLWNRLIDMPYSVNQEQTSLSSVTFGNGEARLTFYETDCIYFEYNSDEELTLFSEESEDTSSLFIEEADGCILAHGFSRNPDDRDTDENTTFTCGVKIIKGKYEISNYKIIIHGPAALSLAVSVLDYEYSDVISALNLSPADFETAESACLESIKEAIGDFSVDTDDEKEAVVAVKALNVLVQNFAKAQGNLRNKISTFPNRGSYPTHFLWDSFFINLAVENMNINIAEDAVTLFKDTQRCDGKYGQFLCSTWIRPNYTQPALIGRAALRCFEKTGNIKFAEIMAHSLEKNNNWWLRARRHFTGLICCPHGLETGQDDAPRFDNGTTVSVDMNSYLLDQMRCTAELFKSIGSQEKCDYWNNKADSFANKIVEYLYDKNDEIFYDINPVTLEPVKIIGTSCFIPLWSGVPLEEEVQKNIIRRYLTNPEYMYGNIPFPSVAYNDSNYVDSLWWRGPLWLPMGYFMLEILSMHGFNLERKEAENRIIKMIIDDGNLCELFNSRTGEGLGSKEQGWTAAIYLYLITK